ncbi:MAG: glycosyltransferase [Chloroflexi bacterium]|nr:glycosyltransferase [Chloroflexota bacterium]
MTHWTLILAQVVHVASALGLAIIGFNALVLSGIYLLRRRFPAPQKPTQPHAWPSVTVQLPLYNERYVVERLIEAVAQLDYPREALHIQILDDSTDQTSVIVNRLVEHYQDQGLNISHVQREIRTGYKAGALRAGLALIDSAFIAVFDADFVPPADFLKATIPHFADPRIGMVQARWAHLNALSSWFTRAQSLALDAHFVVEQTARNRSGLLMNFSGAAGVWRRTCIEDSGGWQADTLSEDIDLSYRAQLRDWACLYLPEVSAPAELPPTAMAFKTQQARWATGTIQCLRKLGPDILRADLRLWQKVQAFLHLSGYLVHPLLILLLLTTLPLMLSDTLTGLPLAGLSLATLGPLLQVVIGQMTLYEDRGERLLVLPAYMMMGLGIALSNTLAVLRGFSNQQFAFERTPKFRSDDQQDGLSSTHYRQSLNAVSLLEAILFAYAAISAWVAWTSVPAALPFMLLYAAGFGTISALSLWQSLKVAHYRGKQLPFAPASKN